MIRCATGTVSISSSLTAGQTFDITTDGASQPLTGFHTAGARAIFFRWLGNQSATGFVANNVKPGMGFATGPAARRAYGISIPNGRATTATDRMWRDDACICILHQDDGVVEGLVDYSGEVTDGFQLIVDDQLASTEIVQWLAIWGDELSHGIVDFTSPAATGNQDYNAGISLDTGQDDKMVFILGGPNVAANTQSVHGYLMFGAAAGNTPLNGVLLGCSQDGQADPVTWGYCRDGECISMSTATDAISERGAVTAWLGSGNSFRINWTEVNGTAGLLRYSALALKGPRFALWDLLSRTDTTQTDEVIGFDPIGIMAFSHSRAENSADTPTAYNTMSVGFATSASSRSAGVSYDEDAVAASESRARRVLRTDCIYIGMAEPVVSAEDALMDLVDMSVGGGGFTFVMDDTEPSQAFVWGIAVGSEITSSAGPALHHTTYFDGAMVEDDWW